MDWKDRETILVLQRWLSLTVLWAELASFTKLSSEYNGVWKYSPTVSRTKCTNWTELSIKHNGLAWFVLTNCVVDGAGYLHRTFYQIHSCVDGFDKGFFE